MSILTLIEYDHEARLFCRYPYDPLSPEIHNYEVKGMAMNACSIYCLSSKISEVDQFLEVVCETLALNPLGNYSGFL